MSCNSRFDLSRTELGRFWGVQTALWTGPKLSWGRVEGCRVDGGGCDGVSELGDLGGGRLGDLQPQTEDWGTWAVLATVNCSHPYSAQCCLHLSKIGNFGKAQVKLCELGDL